eukprot:SAG31_NODE_4233_length_3434_cov_1.980810_6_plen_79_part_00
MFFKKCDRRRRRRRRVGRRIGTAGRSTYRGTAVRTSTSGISLEYMIPGYANYVLYTCSHACTCIAVHVLVSYNEVAAA